MNPTDNETKVDSLPVDLSSVWAQDQNWNTRWEMIQELDGLHEPHPVQESLVDVAVRSTA